MYMINKDIDQITEQDLQELVDNEIIEIKTLEYKAELPGNADSDKKEFLADVSSFANASAGDIIYGITSDNTCKPLAVEGIAINNVDAEIRRLDQIIQSGIEPRISYEPIHHIELGNSKYVLIIRIPRSWRKPHRISFKEDHKFWSRSTSSKYRLDVGELRNIFNLSETLGERIRRFREDRISSIIADETFIPLGENPKVVLHLIPLISFEFGQRYDISIVDKNPGKFNAIGFNTGNIGYEKLGGKYNLDGFQKYFYDNEGGTYAQLFGNGIIESVDGRTISFGKINYRLFAERLINSTDDYLSLMKELSIESPILFFLSLLDIIGYKMQIPNDNCPYDNPNIRYYIEKYSIDRNNLILPEVTIENYDEPVKKILKPCFDSIWNACGLERDFNYDENGNWKA